MSSALQAALVGLDHAFADYVVAPIDAVLFFDLAFWDNGQANETTLPAVVVWLIAGAIFFTLRFGFINFRGFLHAIMCVRGRYTGPDEAGEISHFQALSAALSATVGLGNIAGVAVAVGAGGPGAIFWMVVAGLLGMSSKFAECTLGQKYRILKPDGGLVGGPMIYLRDGLREKGYPRSRQMQPEPPAHHGLRRVAGGGRGWVAYHWCFRVGPVSSGCRGMSGDVRATVAYQWCFRVWRNI